MRRKINYVFNTDWTSEASCIDKADLFFPSEEEELDVKACKEVCMSCPVRLQCLDYSLYCKDEFSVWGGMTHEERQKIAKRNLASQSVLVKKMTDDIDYVAQLVAA